MSKKIECAYREDVDPFFHEVAKHAALNGQYGNYTGYQGVNFLHPTTHLLGYYSVLKFIVKNPGKSRKEIYEHYNTAISITLNRLLDGRLIENVKHRFLPTDLGKSYLIGAKNYLTTRNI